MDGECNVYCSAQTARWTAVTQLLHIDHKLAGLFPQHQQLNLEWLLPEIRPIALLYTRALIKGFLASHSRLCKLECGRFFNSPGVCLWRGAVWAAWSDASWTCPCWKTASDAARSGNAAAPHRKALSVEAEGVGRESLYTPHIGLKSSAAIIYFQTVEKTFIFSCLCGFRTSSQLSVCSSYNSCLCFPLFLFLF